MKLESSNSFRSSHLFHNNRNKLRRIEWFIAIFFIVSLMIGSGIFIKASNASNLKAKNYPNFSDSGSGIIPGSMRTNYTSGDQPVEQRSAVQFADDDTSCELKKEM